MAHPPGDSTGGLFPIRIYVLILPSVFGEVSPDYSRPVGVTSTWDEKRPMFLSQLVGRQNFLLASNLKFLIPEIRHRDKPIFVVAILTVKRSTIEPFAVLEPDEPSDDLLRPCAGRLVLDGQFLDLRWP